MRTTVWLHSHFNLIELLKQADSAGELRIVGSYHSRKYPEVLLADTFVLEPRFDSKAEFVEWCLHFVKEYAVDVFVVGRQMSALSAAAARFESLGCTLISACDSDTHLLINDKVVCYDAICSAGRSVVPLPVYHAAEDAEQFSSAIERLSAAEAIACFKPAVSIFGYGFRVVETPENRHLLQDVPRDLVIDKLGAVDYVSRNGTFEKQIVMEYLPGSETSVDCLASSGELLRAVVRRKNADGSRLLVESAEFVKLASRLTRHFKLTHLFNIQFREKADGRPVLLEINSRMSGGTNMSCLSGLVLPYWGIKLALGQCSVFDIPYPKSGARVAEVKRAVVLR